MEAWEKLGGGVKERAHPKEADIICHIEAYKNTSQLLKYKWKNSRAHVK